MERRVGKGEGQHQSAGGQRPEMANRGLRGASSADAAACRKGAPEVAQICAAYVRLRTIAVAAPEPKSHRRTTAHLYSLSYSNRA